MLGVGDATRTGVWLRAVEGGDKGGIDMADMLLAGEDGLENEPGRGLTIAQKQTDMQVLRKVFANSGATGEYARTEYCGQLFMRRLISASHAVTECNKCLRCS
jgi:hypothetical protein